MAGTRDAGEGLSRNGTISFMVASVKFDDRDRTRSIVILGHLAIRSASTRSTANAVAAWAGRSSRIRCSSFSRMRENARTGRALPATNWLKLGLSDIRPSVERNSLAVQVFASKGVAPWVAEVAPGSRGIAPLAGTVPLGGYYDNIATGAGSDGIADYERANLINPNNTSSNQYNGRVDFTQGNNQFFGGFYYTHTNQLQGGDRPIDDLTFVPTNWLGTIGWTRTITSTLLNDLRANVTRRRNYNQVASSSNTNFGIPFYNDFRLRRGIGGRPEFGSGTGRGHAGDICAEHLRSARYGDEDMGNAYTAVWWRFSEGPKQ